MQLSDLTAILIATIANMALGFIWYLPSVFGDRFLKEIGIDPATSQKTPGSEMLKPLSASIICAIILAVVLLQMVRAPGIESLGQMLQVAFWTWLAFVACVRINHSVFEKKSFTYNAIASGFDFFSILITTVILWFWR